MSIVKQCRECGQGFDVLNSPIGTCLAPSKCVDGHIGPFDPMEAKQPCAAAVSGGWKETFRFELELVLVRTFSEGTFVDLHGQHLIAHQLPETFPQRYGQIPRKIFVRDCYSQLYDKVSDLMLRGSMEFGATLFTGIPGIGKSLFLIYFIYRFLQDDRFPDKYFAVEFHQGIYLCFQPVAHATEEFLCTIQNGSYMQSKRFLLLCDINDTAEPCSRAKWTFIFSSPAPDRYKEILKNAPNFKYTMPTWSELELMFLDIEIAQWYEDFVLFGGVPRHVIPRAACIDPHTKLEATLAEKGGAIAEEFFKFGFGTVDWLQSYMLVHINPPVSDNGDFEYDGLTLYSFASDAIFQWLVNKHNAQMLAGAVGMFNSGASSWKYGGVSAGNLFEKICLWLKPLDGQRITAASLEGGTDVTLDVPPVRYVLPHDWKKTAQLSVNVLILPRISNLESGDAFYVVQCPHHDSFLLVVFQITVGESHPVKVNGLHDILLAFPETVRNKIKHKALVFVIPKHGTLDKKQKLQTQKEKEAILPPKIVKDFEQYVYRHEI
eukprot:gene10110-11190_t